jgi:hypothetical protein
VRMAKEFVASGVQEKIQSELMKSLLSEEGAWPK